MLITSQNDKVYDSNELKMMWIDGELILCKKFFERNDIVLGKYAKERSSSVFRELDYYYNQGIDYVMPKQ